MFKLMPIGVRFIEGTGDDALAAPGATEVAEDITNDTPAETTDQPAEDADTSDAEVKDAEYWKQRSRQWERRAKENQSAAVKLKEYEDANKSELEKALAKVEELTRENENQKHALLRSQIAAKYNITADDAELFLIGSEDEMIRRAEALQAKNRSTFGVDPNQGVGSETGGGKAAANQWADKMLGKTG